MAHLNAHFGLGDDRMFKIPDDPRQTSVGRFLRQYSIDEFPQLWNVLCGQDEPRRPAAADPARAPVRERLGPAPARPDAGPDRSVAGVRTQRGDVLPDARPRLPVRHQLEPLGRHQADPAHRARPDGQDARRPIGGRPRGVAERYWADRKFRNGSRGHYSIFSGEGRRYETRLRGVVGAPLVAEHLAHLADRRLGARAPPASARAGSHRSAAARTSASAASTAAVAPARSAACARTGGARTRVEPVQLDLRSALGRVAVHADDHLLARLHPLVVGERRLLDLVLHPARLDRGDRAAQLVDCRRSAAGLVGQLVGQRLDVVAAGERVGGVGARPPRWRGSAGCAARSSRCARWAGRAPRRSRWCAGSGRRRRPPRRPARATRTMLFSACWAVSVEPPVWAWKRSICSARRRRRSGRA